MTFRIRKNNLILWDYFYWSLVLISFTTLLYLFSLKNGLMFSAIFLLSLITFIIFIEYRNLLIYIIIISLATTFRPPELFHGISVAMPELFIYFLFFLSLPKIFLSIRLRKYLDNSVIKMYLLYTTVIIVSLTVNFFINPETNLSTVRNFILPLLLFILLVINMEENKLQKYIIILIGIAFVTGLVGILQSQFGIFNFVTNVLERNYINMLWGGTIGSSKPATGLTNHWNPYSQYIQIYLFIAFAFSVNPKIRSFKKLYIALFIFFFIIEILTFSRGGYVATLITLLIYMFMHSKKTRIVGIVTSILLFIVIIVKVKPVISKYIDQFETILFRFLLWIEGIKYLFRHPNKILFGTGAGTYATITKQFWTAHNEYILHLVETGLFSLIVLLIFIFVLLKYLYNKYKNEEDQFFKSLFIGLFLGYISFFIHEIVDHIFASVVFKMQLLMWISIIVVHTKRKITKI
jgi:O-antigen ligase